MPLDHEPLDYERDRYLESFTQVFVFFLEDSLTTYARNLIEQIPKSGKWADLTSCIIRIITTGTLLGATGATVGAPVGAVVGAPTISSLLLPLASLSAVDLGVHYNRRKLFRMINLLMIYQRNKDNKLKIRKNLVVASVELFKSFEIKFREATFQKNHELALIKLARDAVERMFNFFSENPSLLEEEDFLSVSNILKAIILGKSKRYRNIFSIPQRHLGHILDNNISTKRFYEDTPILKWVSENEMYCYKRNNAHDLTDFRLIFKWEEDTDESIPWGMDKITLLDNRKYTKSASVSESTLNTLTLFHLKEEELDEKKEKIFFELNSISINKTDDRIYQEMNELKKELMDIKKNISDLNLFMQVMTGQLTQSKPMKTHEVSQEVSDEDRLSAIYNRLKKDLEAADIFEIYIPLRAYFEFDFPHQTQFSLVEKVISFIQTNKQKSLLILGESGVGKTSFLIYLSQFIVKNFFFSIQSAVIPFYMRVSRLRNKNFKTVNSKQLLKDYYKFNDEEIEYVLKRKQTFCFLIDDVELNLELDVLFATLFKNFSSSHFIFTARSLNVLSLINDEEPLVINIALFNEESKLNYISEYKKINLFSSFIEENEKIYQRIKAISNLEKLTDKPFLLKIAMEILNPLEKFYFQSGIVTGPEYIYDDLFHIYTHVMYTKMAENFKFRKGITHINQQRLYDCFLNYVTNLAVLMKEIDMFEIDENLFNNLFFPEQIIKKKSCLKISFEQALLLKKFFSKNYNPILFENDDEFKQYKYGYQGCIVVRAYGMPGNISYAFIHQEFFNYFSNFNPSRRNEIKVFLESVQEKITDYTESVEDRSRHSSSSLLSEQEFYLPARSSSLTNIRRETSHVQRGLSKGRLGFYSMSRRDKGTSSYLSSGHSATTEDIDSKDVITEISHNFL